MTGTAIYEWERSEGRSAWHVINGASAASYTPTAADAGHYLRVSASYTDGHGSGKTAQTVTPNVVLARTLSRLEVVTTSSRQMYPAFDPETLHYAVGCVAADTLRLTLSTTDADTRLAVDGVQYANQNAVVELTGLDGYSDIPITLSGGSDGASTTYTLHCLAEDFPTITVTRMDGASESLMTASYGQYLAIIDHNGVPRFRGQGAGGGHFRAFPDGGYPYAVHVRADSAYTVYDGTFNVVQSGITTVNLHDTNSHDFFVKPNGDYVLIAYEPAVRDLSFMSEQFGLTNEDGEPYGTAEDVEDSVIQVITPAGQEVFLWNSWNHMAIEDCTQHRFPDDYAHINSVQAVDRDIIASLRGCSKVLRIDGTSGDVIWRLGRSNLTTEEWESRNIGPPPLKIVGDPYGEFCGQHAARLLDNGHLILFDNGVQCLEDPRTGGTERVGGQFSRVVEYAIDLEHGEAIFQRHVFLHGRMDRLSYAMGQADALDNGNWLITWGRGLRAPNPGDPPPPDVSATQVNPATGVEALTVVARIDGDVQTAGRMYPVAPVALAAEPIALAAEFPASTYTSNFNLGSGDEPQVVVAFSRPVVDFDATTPSFSVTGATVASVSPHLVAGEPANAYLVGLTPDGDGPVAFRLVAGRACAGGGICGADGTTLSEVPSARVTFDVSDPEVKVSFERATYTVPESDDDATSGVRENELTITVVLDKDPERTVVIPITRANQGGAVAGDYSVAPDPTSVTFTAGGDLRQTITFTATPDTVDDDGESVLLGFDTPNLPTRVIAGTTTQSTVSITDDDNPEVTVQFKDMTYTTTEGGRAATVTVEISADPERDLVIPITAMPVLPATAADYRLSAVLLTFPDSSDADRTFTVTATNDTEDDDGETVELTFGTMPDMRVTASGNTTATVDLVDNDHPEVKVSFERATYTVPESDNPATTSDTENQITITVVLDKDPERTVVIPITKTPQHPTTTGDYSVDPDPTSVTFNAGGDLKQTITFTATPDTVDDDGESVLLGFDTTNLPPRVSLAMTNTQSTVSIEDDDHPEVTVKFGASSINVGEGNSATITVTISADPKRRLTIPIMKVNGNGASDADYAGVLASVTFESGGAPMQTFTFRATQDDIDDGEPSDNEHVTLGFGTMPDMRVTADSPMTQTITIGDDDKRGVAVTPLTLSVNEDDEDHYTVVLTSQPTAAVTVTPGTTSTEVTLSGALRFRPGNWGTPQTVTVTAPADADTVNETLTITHTAIGGDYGTVKPASVAVRLRDNDTASIAISTSGLTIDEGQTARFTVKLNTEPDNDVTVTITSGNPAVATVSDDSLTFTTGDWSTEQAVTVMAADDDGAADNDTMISFEVSGYGSVTTAAPITVSVEDDDTRAVSINTSALTVEEEAAPAGPPTNTYTVVLDTQPTGNVTVAITSDNADIRVNGRNATATSPYNLTFTSTNWNTDQTVTVTVVNDLDGWNEEATLTHAVRGADYAMVNTNSVEVTVTDNDPLGLRVRPAEYTSERVEVSEGTTYSYTLALLTVPLGDVTVAITSNNADVSVEPTRLTISAARWNDPHTVKITVAADADSEDEEANLLHTVTGYANPETDQELTVGPDFLVQVRDLSEPGVFIDPPTLEITEGFDDAYSVSLRTEPSGAVTVQVAGHAGTDVKVMPDSLTFTSSDWNVPQAVTVTTAEDEDADSDTVTLTHSVSGYGTVTTAEDVVVTIVERDEEGITVTDVTPPLEDPNEGDAPATGTYTVVLDTQPSGDVMVAITSNNADVTVMPESLIFTTSDWNQPQTVAVTAAGDADATDDTATLTHKASGSDYSATATVTVTVIDLDDAPTTSTGSGGGGGAGPSGPSPSKVEFEWTVTRDIEQLDSGHDAPTGAWSDGTLLWLAENGRRRRRRRLRLRPQDRRARRGARVRARRDQPRASRPVVQRQDRLGRR